MKPWVTALLTILCIVVIILLTWTCYTACTSPINVNVKIRHGDDNYRCSLEVHNADGSTSFQQCRKSGELEPTAQTAVDAPDNITGN